MAYIAKVADEPNFASSTGNIVTILALTRALNVPATEIASPRILFGNISESSVHVTGPSEIANDAINKRIPASSK